MSFNVQGLLAVCGRQVSKESVRFIATGLGLPLLAEQPPSPMRSLGWHVDRLHRAVDAGCVGLRFDRFGQLSGFAMWAHVAASTSENLLRHGTDALAPATWTEGHDTWLLHLVALRGGLPDLLMRLRNDWLATAPRVTYFRYKRGRRIAKRVDRADRTSFFQRRGSSGSVDASFLRSHEADGLRHAAAATLDAALELGEIVLLARQCPELADLPLPLALHRLRAPLMLSQRRLYRRADGSLCGASTWGWLDDSAPCSAPGDPHLWPLYQWNEGTRLTLCDAFAIDEGRTALLRDLETGWLANEPVWLRPPPGSTAGTAGHRLTPGPRHDAEATGAHGADLMPRLRDAVREMA
jgi:hemolysin-activating ACP:hemolysin acyltransferase